jgi:D-sedoheptulose 7-phosphate isomerase
MTLVETRTIVAEVLARSSRSIASLIELMDETHRDGGCIYLFGNGGSAALAGHFASELIGSREGRRTLGAAWLAADAATVTAQWNDVGERAVFARPIKALCAQGDTCVGISSSGTSRNIVSGLEAAREVGAHTALLVGCAPVPAPNVDIIVELPLATPPLVQEAHLMVIHIVCEALGTL